MQRTLEEEVGNDDDVSTTNTQLSSDHSLPFDVWKGIFFCLYDEVGHLIYQQCTVSKLWFSYLMKSILSLEQPFMEEVQCHLKIDDCDENRQVLLKWESFLSKLVNLKYIDIETDDEYAIGSIYNQKCPLKLVLLKMISEKKMFNNMIAFFVSNTPHDMINTILPSLKSLKWLSLTDCDVKDECLYHCEFQLIHLKLIKCHLITGNLFKESKWSKELDEFHVECLNNYKILTNVVQSMENLRILFVSDDKLDLIIHHRHDDYTMKFGSLKELVILHLNDSRLIHNNESLLSLPSSLISLSIRLFEEDEVQDDLTHLKSLQYLRICDFCDNCNHYTSDWTKTLPNIFTISISIGNSNTLIIDKIIDLYSNHSDFEYSIKNDSTSDGSDDTDRKLISITKKNVFQDDKEG